MFAGRRVITIAIDVMSGDHPPREYVAWGWALNGFASVVGSVLATILAMTYGFGAVLVVAFCAYVVAFGALQGLSRRLRSA